MRVVKSSVVGSAHGTSPESQTKTTAWTGLSHRFLIVCMCVVDMCVFDIVGCCGSVLDRCL